MSFCRTSKTKKEEGMKKTLVIMLALFLAIPAISYAGSATSRWDMTIGGNIKFDMGWADQSGGNSRACGPAGSRTGTRRPAPRLPHDQVRQPDMGRR